MKSVIDNASGPTGVFGILLGKCIPCDPAEWLILFSTCLVICQLIHWGYRFFNWVQKG